MGWQVGPECFQTVTEAANAACVALDDFSELNWQWCGIAFDGDGHGSQPSIVSVNEAAGSAVVQMWMDASPFNKTHTLKFRACQVVNVAEFEPAIQAFEVGLALLLGAVALMRFWRGPAA